jgi:hypothetical protein
MKDIENREIDRGFEVWNLYFKFEWGYYGYGYGKRYGYGDGYGNSNGNGRSNIEREWKE